MVGTVGYIESEIYVSIDHRRDLLILPSVVITAGRKRNKRVIVGRMGYC